MSINRGTGAGGANTNKNGKSFEDKTSNEDRLLAMGFEKKKTNSTKYGYFLSNTLEDGTTVIFMTQSGLKEYFKKTFNIEMIRNPDEAYLLKKGDKYILKVLEKKNQNVAGSVDTKLLAGPGFVEEYKACLGPTFEVEYAYCLSSFLQEQVQATNQKSTILRKIMGQHKIQMFFGDDADYFDKLDAWIGI